MWGARLSKPFTQLEAEPAGISRDGNDFARHAERIHFTLQLCQETRRLPVPRQADDDYREVRIRGRQAVIIVCVLSVADRQLDRWRIRICA